MVLIKAVVLLSIYQNLLFLNKHKKQHTLHTYPDYYSALLLVPVQLIITSAEKEYWLGQKGSN